MKNSFVFILFSIVLQSKAFATDSVGYWTSSQVEAITCISYTQDTGVDPQVCAEEPLPACQVPDWFAVVGEGGVADHYVSTPDTRARWNQTEFFVDHWDHFEHTWYSDNNVPYGPAIPSKGHEWNEYHGSELVRSFTCNSRISYSYP